MTQHMFRLAALGALLTGLAKTWLHLGSGAVLMLEGCRGSVFSVPLESTPGHCWGCYVALAGAFALAGSFMSSRRMLTRRARVD